MRQIIIFFIIALVTYASANSAPDAPKDGPYDWNNFLTEVSTTCKDVEVAKDKIEKNISTDPTIRSNQQHEVAQMLTRIILIQDMIKKEFNYRDHLDQSQKDLVEQFKNKALRLRQELVALDKQLNN